MCILSYCVHIHIIHNCAYFGNTSLIVHLQTHTPIYITYLSIHIFTRCTYSYTYHPAAFLSAIQSYMDFGNTPLIVHTHTHSYTYTFHALLYMHSLIRYFFMHTHTQTHMHTRARAHKHTHTYLYVCTRSYDVYIHIRTHTHTHSIHAHVHIRTIRLLWCLLHRATCTFITRR